MNVIIMLALGYGLKRLVGPSGFALTRVEMGRRWFGWMAMIAALAAAGGSVKYPFVEVFARWLVGLIVYGGVAFGIGYAVGPRASASEMARQAALARPPKKTTGTDGDGV